MRKIIWTAWLQGRDGAPPLVKACIDSWVAKNPEWDVRIVDAASLEDHTNILSEFDFDRQKITPASFSDILRTGILEENGGVWVDATAFCNRPLDEWLPDAAASGFFAFAKPAPNRPMASWFLAVDTDHPLPQRLRGAVLRYWQGRMEADKYFWFHSLIQAIFRRSPDMLGRWREVPVMPAVASNQLHDLAHMPFEKGRNLIDWTVPVFKLSHKVPVSATSAPLLHGVLDLDRFEGDLAVHPLSNPILDRLAPSTLLPGPKVKIRKPMSAARIRKTLA